MKKITRRQALGTTAGALTVLGLTAAAAGATSAAATPTEPTTPGAVDEVYKGRRIQITAGGGGHHGGHHSPGQPTVRIDGQELHIMRNADGTWISVINHYETFADPKLLARAAVRDLQGAALVPFGGAA
ncbi:tyrosinase cofactor [Streptomyces virginiae]|uniref:apotyrosinase chaperone MelC1 n=1 Tax=Streptomyces TaxID=1883 RepID=UPI0005259154|nr:MULTISPECIES: tyrosinase cofactor [Streptomyces]MCX4717373.1 tyrosinase cofactor [Streptomyces virginiae]MCX5277223.1 tyrosinase cofactor [Streptomyces virginiae]MYV79511.1 tyrosinase [Streptomyces sp. SID1046]WSC81657.1 tyrosinase cofactor [Streptomyces virginiae]